jgi:hypothetical protein
MAAKFTDEVAHKFVIAPETMPIDQWLATRDQPRCLAADEGHASGAHEISKLVAGRK